MMTNRILTTTLVCVLAGCAHTDGDAYVQALAARCTAMGAPASDVDRHIACVERLHAQQNAQDAAASDRFRDALNRDTRTDCRSDGLGGVRCTSR